MADQEEQTATDQSTEKKNDKTESKSKVAVSSVVAKLIEQIEKLTII